MAGGAFLPEARASLRDLEKLELTDWVATRAGVALAGGGKAAARPPHSQRAAASGLRADAEDTGTDAGS